MTESKKSRMAYELDTRVRCLRLAGLDDTVLFFAMSDRLDDLKALMDAAGPNGLDSFAHHLPDLRYYAALLADIAAGIQDGTSASREEATIIATVLRLLNPNQGLV